MGAEVVLLDRATGRLMELTKLQGGLHQAIEAKSYQTFSRDVRWLPLLIRVSFENSRRFRMTGTGRQLRKNF